jgi:hypothetical protein
MCARPLGCYGAKPARKSQWLLGFKRRSLGATRGVLLASGRQMVLDNGAVWALSSPLAESAATAKYQVPVVNPVTV